MTTSPTPPPRDSDHPALLVHDRIERAARRTEDAKRARDLARSRAFAARRSAAVSAEDRLAAIAAAETAEAELKVAARELLLARGAATSRARGRSAPGLLERAEAAARAPELQSKLDRGQWRAVLTSIIDDFTPAELQSDAPGNRRYDPDIDYAGREAVVEQVPGVSLWRVALRRGDEVVILHHEGTELTETPIESEAYAAATEWNDAREVVPLESLPKLEVPGVVDVLIRATGELVRRMGLAPIVERVTSGAINPWLIRHVETRIGSLDENRWARSSGPKALEACVACLKEACDWRARAAASDARLESLRAAARKRAVPTAAELAEAERALDADPEPDVIDVDED